MKICTNPKCIHGGAPQQLNSFWKNKINSDGLQCWCKVCMNCSFKRYAETPEGKIKLKSRPPENKIKRKIRDSRPDSKTRKKIQARKYQTGFDEEKFNRTMDNQRHLCAICHCDLDILPVKQIHADHCHVNKKPRGILCSHCNHLLGNAKDSLEVLENAIKYLNYWNVTFGIDVASAQALGRREAEELIGRIQ